MTSLALACRLGAVTAPRSIPRRVRSILNKYGATMLLPGAAEPILGPELVVNGGLDSAAGWSLSGTATVSGGVCDIPVGGTGWLEQGVATKAATMYRVAATVSVGATFCGAWDSSGRSALLSNSAAGRQPGQIEFFFTANDTLSYIAFTSTGGTATRLDNISVREFLGYNHTRYSYQAGNYRESTGQTLAAADQQVGLVVDAARVPGPELRGGFVAQIAGSAAPATYNTATGAGTCNRVDVSNQSSIRLVGLLVGGRYAVSVTNTGLASVSVRTAAGAVILFSVASGATVVQTIVPQSVGDLVIQGGIDGTSCTFVVNSVRELPGIHASQSTSGFQPVLRQEPILGPELVTNGDFSNGVTGWTDNAGIATTFESVIHDGVRCLRVVTPAINGGASQVALLSGKLQTVSYRIKVVSGSMYVGISGNETGGVRNTTNSGSWTTVRNQYYGATNPVLRAYALSAAEFYITDISVREITGYDSRIQSWQFDGTDDRLSLSAVPFQMADDHFVVLGLSSEDVYAERRPFFVRNGTTMFGITFGGSGQNTLAANWIDDAGLNCSVSSANAVHNNTNYAVSMRKAGNSKTLRRDGVQLGLNTVQLGTATLGAAVPFIGMENGVSRPFRGPIHGVIFGKGAITDSELLTLERFMATLQGRTI